MLILTDFWRPLSSQVEDCPGTCRLMSSCQPNAVELCPGSVPREAVALVLCHSAPCCSLPLSSAKPFNAKGLLVNRLVHSYVFSCFCPTLCHPMDCSLPGASVHGIFQARILAWVAIPSSRGSSWPRDQIQFSCTAGRFFTVWATKEAWGFPQIGTPVSRELSSWKFSSFRANQREKSDVISGLLGLCLRGPKNPT